MRQGAFLLQAASAGISVRTVNCGYREEREELHRKIPDYYTYLCAFNKYNTMQNQGTVKFFDTTKGFGFIKPNNGGQDIFVHSTGLIDEIRENDTVEYDVESGRKGVNAVNVKVI
jgi:cold shock protein